MLDPGQAAQSADDQRQTDQQERWQVSKPNTQIGQRAPQEDRGKSAKEGIVLHDQDW